MRQTLLETPSPRVTPSAALGKAPEPSRVSEPAPIPLYSSEVEEEYCESEYEEESEASHDRPWLPSSTSTHEATGLLEDEDSISLYAEESAMDTLPSPRSREPGRGGA